MQKDRMRKAWRGWGRRDVAKMRWWQWQKPGGDWRKETPCANKTQSKHNPPPDSHPGPVKVQRWGLGGSGNLVRTVESHTNLKEDFQSTVCVCSGRNVVFALSSNTIESFHGISWPGNKEKHLKKPLLSNTVEKSYANMAWLIQRATEGNSALRLGCIITVWLQTKAKQTEIH